MSNMEEMTKKLSLSDRSLKLGSIDPDTLKVSKNKPPMVEIRRKNAGDLIRGRVDQIMSLRDGHMRCPVLFDTTPAKESDNITAGITNEDISDAYSCNLFSKVDVCIQRTEAIDLITGIKRSGHYKNSTYLSRDMTPFLTHKSLSKEEKELYSLAFPHHDESRGTLCTPLGAKVMLNFLAVYGSESYIWGVDEKQRERSLWALNEYAGRKSEHISEKGCFIQPKREKLAIDKKGKLTFRKSHDNENTNSFEDVSREANGQFKTGYNRPEDWNKYSITNEKKLKTVEDQSAERSMFRKNLLRDKTNKPVCPMTGVSDERFLKASHIKPFRSCANSEEKTDPHNGILLAYDADWLFDRGYITFTSDGVLVRSTEFKIHGGLLSSLGLNQHSKLPIKSNRMKGYLAWHKQYVFEGEGCRQERKENE
tara:strand:+ start:49 stop:1317 length:1269 start_codon:yes stop_codon:yes gene_type:complete